MKGTSKEKVTEDKMYLELQRIINQRLYDRNVIDRGTYEKVNRELLKQITNN